MSLKIAIFELSVKREVVSNLLNYNWKGRQILNMYVSIFIIINLFLYGLSVGKNMRLNK